MEPEVVGNAKPTPPDILKSYKEKNINLEALFDGGNPFEAADGPVAETAPVIAEEEIDGRDPAF